MHIQFEIGFETIETVLQSSYQIISIGLLNNNLIKIFNDISYQHLLNYYSLLSNVLNIIYCRRRGRVVKDRNR